MGLNPSAGLALESVSAANNCGVMVGRAYDSVKKQNLLFVLAKDGCRIPSIETMEPSKSEKEITNDEHFAALADESWRRLHFGPNPPPFIS